MKSQRTPTSIILNASGASLSLLLLFIVLFLFLFALYFSLSLSSSSFFSFLSFLSSFTFRLRFFRWSKESTQCVHRWVRHLPEFAGNIRHWPASSCRQVASRLNPCTCSCVLIFCSCVLIFHFFIFSCFEFSLFLFFVCRFLSNFCGTR